MATASLASVQLQMTGIVLPICIVIGNLGSAIGLFVFLQKSLRKNTCVLFLIGYIISNLVYIDFTILIVVLTNYGVDIAVQSEAFCHIRIYINYVFSIIPSYLLVMASIDRMFISSPNVRTRLRINRRIALFLIGGISLFWSLFHLYTIFFSEIQLLYGTWHVCNIPPGGLSIFVTFYSLICDGKISLLSMAGFGIQTLINVKRSGRNRVHKKHQHLIALLLVQLIVYIFLRLPTPLYLIYQQITISDIKSSDQVAIDGFMFFIVLFCEFIQVNVFPLMNLTSNSFRTELKRGIYKITHRNVPTHSQIKNGITKQGGQIVRCLNNTNAVNPM